MNAASFFESITSERNKSGQGVQRDLLSSDIPPEIYVLIKQGLKISK